MPTDYACAVLEEGKMLRVARSDIICYSTKNGSAKVSYAF
jgi:hypothetical protein